MTSQVSPSGENRFVAPTTNLIPDLNALARPSLPASSVRGIGPPRIRGPFPVGKEHPGPYYIRVEWYDARGGSRQQGYPEDHASVASGDMVCDAPGIVRLPFQTVAATTPDPTANTYRMSSANALGVMVAAVDDTVAQALY